MQVPADQEAPEAQHHPPRGVVLGCDSVLRSDGAAALLLVAAALALYLATLLPGIDSKGDTTKWQFLGKVLGTPHPTGYPLYLLVTHLVSHLPVQSLAWRINAFSALCAALAVTGVFFLLRQLALPRWYSLLGGLLFACTATLWSQAVVAEVYSLNVAFVCFTLLCFVRWRKTRADRDLLLACLLYALSFTHHLTVVCLLPAVVLLVVATDRSVFAKPRLVLPTLGFIAAGLSCYAYLFWRTSVGGPHVEYRISSLLDFANYVSGDRYAKGMFARSLPELLVGRLTVLPRLLWQELPLLVFFAPWGLFRLRDRVLSLFFGLALLGYAVFNLNYEIRDIHLYYIPVHAMLAILALKGLWEAWPPADWRLSRAGKHVAVGAFALFLLAYNFTRNDRRDSTAFHDRVQSFLDAQDGGAVFIMNGWGPDYAYFEGVLYFLLGEDYQHGRLFALTPPPPEELTRYLRGEGTLSSEVMRAEIPSGLPVFFLSNRKVSERQPGGIRAEPVRDDLYRLLLAPDER